MAYEDIIENLQQTIISMQNTLDLLKLNDERFVQHILFSREEAAEFLGISVRQVDRMCNTCDIHKIKTAQGVKIRRAELLPYRGLIHTHVVNKI